MKGLPFEHHCKKLLEQNGYTNVVLTPSTGDYGIDVIAYLNDTKIGVQCKDYSDPVSNKAVQEAYTGAKYYNCDRAVVLTNNIFTDPAYKLASSTGVELWDKEILTILERSLKTLDRIALIEILKAAKKEISNTNNYCCLCGYSILGGPIYTLDSYLGPKFFESKTAFNEYKNNLITTVESDYMFYVVYNNRL